MAITENRLLIFFKEQSSIKNKKKKLIHVNQNLIFKIKKIKKLFSNYKNNKIFLLTIWIKMEIFI